MRPTSRALLTNVSDQCPLGTSAKRVAEKEGEGNEREVKRREKIMTRDRIRSLGNARDVFFIYEDLQWLKLIG
jgi:hypothetical protein